MSSRHAALARLLLELFNADELRRLLRGLPDGQGLVDALPERSTPATLADAAAALLDRRGRIDIGLFEAVAKSAGNHLAEVKTVADLWGIGLDTSQKDADDAPAAAPKTPAKPSPSPSAGTFSIGGGVTIQAGDGAVVQIGLHNEKT